MTGTSIPNISISIEMRRIITCQNDIGNNSVLTAFIEKIEEKSIDTTLNLFIGKAKIDVGNEMLEMVRIWENVIKNEITTERIALMQESGNRLRNGG
jgi:hypothetical protein